jgi:hypothetical protein
LKKVGWHSIFGNHVDFFDCLKAINMTRILWWRSDSINDVPIHPITLNPHLIAHAKQAPGKGVGVLLTIAIVNLRHGAPSQTGVPTVG